MVSDYEPRDVEVVGPGRVLLGGQALLDLAVLLQPTVDVVGAKVPAGVLHAWPALRREAMAVQMAMAAKQRLLADPPAPGETVTVADAAALLEVHERQVRRRAESGRYGARKWHGAWVLDRRLVELDAPRRPQSDVR